jgi:hypothetical protein
VILFLNYQNLVAFGMIPVSAGLLHLLYRRSGRLYVQHLVFSAHVVSFATLTALPMVLPWQSTLLEAVLLGVTAGYLVLALRRVYDERGVPALGKAFLLMTGYWTVVVIALIGAFVFYYARG